MTGLDREYIFGSLILIVHGSGQRTVYVGAE
jgi:hypothetical protein